MTNEVNDTCVVNHTTYSRTFNFHVTATVIPYDLKSWCRLTNRHSNEYLNTISKSLNYYFYHRCLITLYCKANVIIHHS